MIVSLCNYFNIVLFFHPEALPTVNFMEHGKGAGLMELIRGASPDFPILVMEFWAGWFDHWGKPRATMSTKCESYTLYKELLLLNTK